MKWAFTILLGIHGVIHLLGFVKAFFSTETTKQVLGIPMFVGALWIIVFIMFIATAAAFFNNKKWFYMAFIAVFISQILIVSVWKEAKFGSILNVIILLVGILAYGNYQFEQMVKNESFALFQKIKTVKTPIVSKESISHLPKIVQKWMINSGVVTHHKIASVRLKQKGFMKPNTKWIPFSANQYFNVETPAFVWVTKLNNNSIIYTLGRDKLDAGKGKMSIKLLGLIPVVNESNHEKLNAGTMQRFLSEMCWFPSAALNKYVNWEAIDNTSAKATLTINNKSVSGIFNFNADGNITSFKTNRYFGGKEDSKLEKWVVNMTDYKVFDGIKIPYKCEVTWRLKRGDFNWLNLEIIDLEYNTLKPY